MTRQSLLDPTCSSRSSMQSTFIMMSHTTGSPTTEPTLGDVTLTGWFRAAHLTRPGGAASPSRWRCSGPSERAASRVLARHDLSVRSVVQCRPLVVETSDRRVSTRPRHGTGPPVVRSEDSRAAVHGAQRISSRHRNKISVMRCRFDRFGLATRRSCRADAEAYRCSESRSSRRRRPARPASRPISRKRRRTSTAIRRADAVIWLGRRLASDASTTRSRPTPAASAASQQPRLYRHRGHRYITIRKFDLAILICGARRSDRGQPDVISRMARPTGQASPAARCSRTSGITSVWRSTCPEIS
jgi:hypothetical protein